MGQSHEIGRGLEGVQWIVQGSDADPELLPGSGSGIINPDPGPAKNERPDKIKFYFSF